MILSSKNQRPRESPRARRRRRGAPAPGLFQQSLMFLDSEGKSLRYRNYYSPTYSDEWKFPAPPPPRAR